MVLPVELSGDRFYEQALIYCFEAGHTTTLEAKYINHSTEQFVFFDCANRISLSKEHKNLLDLFDNVSHLFTFYNCGFFSLELLVTRKFRSQVAHDIHMMIHPGVGLRASVCFFRFADEIMLSFVGYGSSCILSDWYPIDDRYGELALRLDLANVSLATEYDYFFDMVYSLKRDYYHFTDDNSVYNLVPINFMNQIENGELGKDDLDYIIKCKMRETAQKYGDDYIEYDDAGEMPVIDIGNDLELMLIDLDEEEDNPFGEEIEVADDDQWDIDEEDEDREKDEYEYGDLDPEVFRDPTLLVKLLKKDETSKQYTSMPKSISDDHKFENIRTSELSNKVESKRYQNATKKSMAYAMPSLLSPSEISREIIRVLQLSKSNLDQDAIRRRSPILSRIEKRIINEEIIMLCLNGTIKKTVSKSHRTLYSINDQELLDDTQRNKTRSKPQALKRVAPVLPKALEKKSIPMIHINAGQCPFGYTISNGELSIIEDEAVIVRRIFSLYDKRKSAIEIAEILASEGYTTRNGGPIAPNRIYQIWTKKELYNGHLQEQYGNYSAIIGSNSVSKGESTLTNSHIRMHQEEKPNINKQQKDIDYSLESKLLTILTLHPVFLSMSELYIYEPSLSKYKRSLIISSLMNLIEKSLVVRDIRENERGVEVMKYKINKT